MSWFSWQALTPLWVSHKAAHNMLPEKSPETSYAALDRAGCFVDFFCEIPNLWIITRKYQKESIMWQMLCPYRLLGEIMHLFRFFPFMCSLYWASSSACTCGKWAPPASWTSMNSARSSGQPFTYQPECWNTFQFLPYIFSRIPCLSP